MDYNEWTNIQVGDRVTALFSGKGTVISAFGIGKLVRWDDGKVEKVQNGCLHVIDKK